MPRKTTLYAEISSLLIAIDNCQAKVPDPLDEHGVSWTVRHQDRLEKLVRDFMPSGSGIDNGTKFDQADLHHQLPPHERRWCVRRVDRSHDHGETVAGVRYHDLHRWEKSQRHQRLAARCL